MLQIHEFNPQEVEPLARMWRESFEYGVGITDTNPIEAQINYFQKEIAHTNRVRLAKLEGRIIGVVASNSESVNLLYVRVGFHRQGIGKKLLELVKSESSGNLWLYTFARNKVACAFYEGQGFVIVQRGFEPFWQLEDVKFHWSRCDA